MTISRSNPKSFDEVYEKGEKGEVKVFEKDRTHEYIESMIDRIEKRSKVNNIGQAIRDTEHRVKSEESKEQEENNDLKCL